MGNKRKPIDAETRSKLLLWCARHCCFCGKACTINMEIHHIDLNSGNSDEDNLIPLCFDCHGELVRYNPKHPKGSKYRDVEIKARREQIYELHTIKYLRQVEIQASRRKQSWDRVYFTVATLSQDLPLQLKLSVQLFHDQDMCQIDRGELYSGMSLWNLNPGQVVLGNLKSPSISSETNPFYFRFEVEWSIVDVLKREHKMLPFSFIASDPSKDWWYQPKIGYEPLSERR
ncbi:MAG: HNH endonuclease signature motif containing protein [Syntrophobacteraceae bacterium]